MKRQLLPLLLALCLLWGCAGQTSGEPPAQPEATEEAAPAALPPQPTEIAARSDGVFTLAYEPKASLDPLAGTNLYNVTLFSLLYEGLFRLDEQFNPVPVLCERWESEDGLTWVFTLKENILFHDGTPLTAEDVVYTINRAAGGNKYAARLRGILAVNARDERTVVIVLRQANRLFPARLDLPIVKSGTLNGAEPPVGTGPYVLAEDTLRAFPEHRDADTLPLEEIRLAAVPTAELGMAFTGQELDLLELDPSGSLHPSVQGDHEARYYDTSTLVYLAFNTRSASGRDAAVRRALSWAFDRESVAETYLAGGAVPAPLVLSPALAEYDPSWEEGTGFDRAQVDALLYEDGVMDMNDDGYWDVSRYSDSLRFRVLVNKENETHLALAEAVANRLEILGFRTELISLSYAAYTTTLKVQNFDIALCEVRLTGDFDLSPLLGSGGSLNFSLASGYDALLSDYLKTEGEAHTEALRALCAYAKEDCAILPLAYKKTAVLTHMGAVQDFTPTQSGVFCTIADCTIRP